MELDKTLAEAFATVQRLLRAERHVECDSTPSGLCVHLPGKPACVVCRLVDLGGDKPCVLVPLPAEQVTNLVPLLEVTAEPDGGSRIALMSRHDLRVIGPALCAAWDARSASGSGNA